MIKHPWRPAPREQGEVLCPAQPSPPDDALHLTKKSATYLLLAAIPVAGVLLLGPQATAARADVCVAANNAVRVQHGTATCQATGTGSVAVVHGTDSTATATGGDKNHAKVKGDNSRAEASGGNGNAATVTGDSSIAFAGEGSGNTATVTGNGSTAATGLGSGNIATVTGDNSTASATAPQGCTATVTGDGQSATCP